jgi:hypothetical protein
MLLVSVRHCSRGSSGTYLYVPIVIQTAYGAVSLGSYLVRLDQFVWAGEAEALPNWSQMGAALAFLVGTWLELKA